ncbi:MAG: alanine--tRNA ligase [Saccharofermentanales bacterium]|nr:alanine--tRNA ligase [Bacillota bacterium]
MVKFGLNQLRELFLSFFEEKGHLRLPSFSLIPQHDPSLLLINAGMTPMKPYFTGALEPPSLRVTTCQKCLRTPDIDHVGKTSRHATFFEMLGNFSFGDYFKAEAIAWAWEFLTQVLEIPSDRLYATVYLEDDEAHAIWETMPIDHSHISRLGKADNYWEHGVGPCGPCSEIYYDRGIEYGCGDFACAPGCDCDRFVEVWNLVFTQFYREEDGSYTVLDQKNIDTGMGLERLAAVMQGVENIFEVDTIRELLNTVADYCRTAYGEDEINDISLRVIADHLRSAVMLISDGVFPGNEGRGYVLRRLIRRAARHGRLLGIERPFLFELVPKVITISGSVYPELIEREKLIVSSLRMEEERFSATIAQGLSVLKNLIARVQEKAGEVLPGSDAFKLHDTFGFPIDLTREIAAEAGIDIDESGFREQMERQRETARQALRAKAGSAWDAEAMPEELAAMMPTEFTGYDQMRASGQISLLILQQPVDGKLSVIEQATPGDRLLIVVPGTPFYAEGGGQKGDVGWIRTETAVLKVDNTMVTDQGVYLHYAELVDGQIQVGDEVILEVDQAVRLATARNHTATHLLHQALRQVLGEQVHQAGSYVEADYLRFDFTHQGPLTPEQRDTVEWLVNEAIDKDFAITAELVPLAEATTAGALALFDEKYTDPVRMIRIGDFSLELCGGTHLSHSGQVQIFALLSESGIAAGVRRIEAVTGLKALSALLQFRHIVRHTADKLKTTGTELVNKIDSLQSEIKDLQHELSTLRTQDIAVTANKLLAQAAEIGPVTAVIGQIEVANAEDLRTAGDRIRDHFDNGVVVLAATVEDKILWLAMATKSAVAVGIHAGDLVREAARITGGGGGGRPEMAQAGGRDPDKLDQALTRVKKLIEQQVEQ